MQETERDALLHHIAVGSLDVARLAAFYSNVLGLAELARHHDSGGVLRSIWLDLGGAALMIERTDQEPRWVDGIAAGPFLLAFRVSPAERQRLELELAAHGLPIEGRTAYTSYTRDPDGNRVGISHYPDPGPADPREGLASPKVGG
jgi:catechol 2,3-dioxygenase-like lactoylglutathione lyase family enzyme